MLTFAPTAPRQCQTPPQLRQAGGGGGGGGGDGLGLDT